MAPESGSSSPAIILSSVVLPAPFGPHRPTRSRGVICHVTWSSRTRSPYDFVSSDSWIMPWQPVVKVRLHSAGAASLLHPNAAAALGTPGRAALLLAQILPVF